MDYSPKALSSKWTVSHPQVLDLIKKGLLQAFNVSSKGPAAKKPTYRISAAEVARFEAENLVCRSTPVAPVAPVAPVKRPRQARFYP